MATIDDLDAKLDALDAKLDALEQKIEAERELSAICTNCGGTGYLTTITDIGNQQQEVQFQCPTCAGQTKILYAVMEAL